MTTAETVPVRVGILGAGGIVRSRHLPGLKPLAGVEVVAVANRSRESGQRVAEEWGIPRVADDWRQIVQDEAIDAVIIGTWPYMHREMSVAALEAGKHVFCQARMATDLAEARLMLDAARKHPHLVNMLCPPPHRMPWEPFVRDALASGLLGELREVRLVSVGAANANPHTITWREQAQYSGKQVLQMGIWAETLIAWVGPYQSLHAVTATPLATKTDAQSKTHRIDIPQIVSIHGTLATGVPISEHHSGLSLHDDSNYVLLQGSSATLRIDAMQRISLGEAGGPLQPLEVPAQMQRDWQVERDFIDAVRKAMRGEPPEQRRVSPDFAEGMLYMQKVEAVHVSAEAGRAIDPSTL